MGAKITIKLRQQTPMIHFQHNEHGAIIRGSELKPKLDRFLMKKYSGQGLEKYCLPSKENTCALNYKVRIYSSSDEKPEKSEEINKEIELSRLPRESGDEKRRIKADYKDKSINGLYFGNMVDKSANDYEERVKESYKESVFYKQDITVEIICMYKDLLDKIGESFDEFLMLTNFGTRQGKGFGSFWIKDKDPIESMKKTKRDFYYVKNEKYLKNYNDALKDIGLIYGFMKSGFNYTRSGNLDDKNYVKGYIFKYFLDKKIHSDKAFSKSRVLKLSQENDINHEKFQYVRGLLGINDGVNYRTYTKNRNKEVIIYNEEIKRFPSPVFFKVVNDYIFIIPNKDYPEGFLGSKFAFISKNEKNHSEVANDEAEYITQFANKNNRWLNIPNEFDLDDFMKEFVKDFNDKDKEWGKTKSGGAITINTLSDRRLEVAKKIKILHCDKEEHK